MRAFERTPRMLTRRINFVLVGETRAPAIILITQHVVALPGIPNGHGTLYTNNAFDFTLSFSIVSRLSLLSALVSFLLFFFLSSLLLSFFERTALERTDRRDEIVPSEIRSSGSRFYFGNRILTVNSARSIHVKVSWVFLSNATS